MNLSNINSGLLSFLRISEIIVEELFWQKWKRESYREHKFRNNIKGNLIIPRFPFPYCGRRDLNPHVVSNTRSLV